MLNKLKKPEVVIPSKPKFMLSGESGVGKTMFALSFLNPVFVDCEKGGNRPQYQKKLKEAGGSYFGQEDGANDYTEVINLVKQLATEKHDYKTLIIDSVSHLYLTEASRAEEEVGNDFGRDKKAANKPTRQLLRWIDKCDMTVILIAHSKNAWERKGKEIINVGTTFDFYDKAEYILDLWCEIQKGGKTFIVRKSRIESLPAGNSFPLSYERFSELYGKDILESEHKPVSMATDDQISRFKELIGIFNIPEAQVTKWFTKANVDEINEMTKDQLNDLIIHIESKTKGK